MENQLQDVYARIKMAVFWEKRHTVLVWWNSYHLSSLTFQSLPEPQTLFDSSQKGSSAQPMQYANARFAFPKSSSCQRSYQPTRMGSARHRTSGNCWSYFLRFFRSAAKFPFLSAVLANGSHKPHL